ncbi:type ISP restriction/modification enzyme [Streptomyces lunaelactis]|uniref:type ISP restriction/modification enzyme n=1 Tax=Streptomyces lunaelactis TaxID=1535768 RepID=UPI00158554ED|nr:type ISP restriction/modification enzyme [Streptomyces lunaelactis]NUK14018.1 hypothetical protein [Streptomyces lunaelactis]
MTLPICPLKYFFVRGHDRGAYCDVVHATTHTLTMGAGTIAPVSPEVWDYRIGGERVVRKWFNFRKRKPNVEHQTPLNDIFPVTWPPEYTTELLSLLNVLGSLVAIEPEHRRRRSGASESEACRLVSTGGVGRCSTRCPG